MDKSVRFFILSLFILATPTFGKGPSSSDTVSQCLAPPSTGALESVKRLAKDCLPLTAHLQDPHAPPTEAQWKRLINLRIQLAQCQIYKDYLIEYSPTKNSTKLHSEQIKILLQRMVDFPTPPLREIPVFIPKQDQKSQEEARDLFEHADFCIAFAGSALTALLKEAPRLLLDPPPPLLMTADEIWKLKEHFALRRMGPRLKYGIQNANPEWKYWNTVYDNADKIPEQITTAVIGLPGALIKNAWATLEGIGTMVVHPILSAQGIYGAVSKLGEITEDDFWNAVLTDDPAQVSAGVVTTFFGAKVAQKVTGVARSALAARGEKLALKVATLPEAELKKSLIAAANQSSLDDILKKQILEEIEKNPKDALSKMVNAVAALNHDAKFPRALNRNGITTATQRIASEAKRVGEKNVYVASFDLGNFKTINDVFGHGRGDDALRAFIESAHTHTRGSDFLGIVARDGGDEFILSFPARNADEAKKVMDRLKEEFKKSQVISQIKDDLLPTDARKTLSPEQISTLQKNLGPEWEQKIRSGTVTIGESEYGLQEIAGQDLQTLATSLTAEDHTKIFNSALKEADNQLIAKKARIREAQGTQRGK